MTGEQSPAGTTVPFVLGVLVGLAFVTALLVGHRLSRPHVWVALSSGREASCTIYAEARR